MAAQLFSAQGTRQKNYARVSDVLEVAALPDRQPGRCLS